jgi:hypothetical protein
MRRQESQPHDEQHEVNPSLSCGFQRGTQPVRVRITSKQQGLEDHQAGSPNGCGAAEGRQQKFRYHRLDREQQEGTQKDCRRE